MKRFLLAIIALRAALSTSLEASSAARAWGGETWKIVPNPIPDSLTNSSLRSVATISSHDIWAVDTSNDQTLIEHRNGTRWSIIASPNNEQRWAMEKPIWEVVGGERK